MSRDKRGNRTQEGSLPDKAVLLSGSRVRLYLGLYDGHGRRLMRPNRGIIAERHFAAVRSVSS